MAEVIDAASKGMPVLGICNGFQILVESHLLPGGLIRNDGGDFVCRDQRLRVENDLDRVDQRFTPGQEIVIPLKNGEGGYIADDETLACSRARAASCSATRGEPERFAPRHRRHRERARQRRRPHAASEHATEPGFGPDTPDAMRSGIDGLTFFTSALTSFAGR